MTITERPNVEDYTLVLTMYGRVAVVDILRPDDSTLDSTVQAVPNSQHMLPTRLQEEAWSLADGFAERLGFDPIGEWYFSGSKSARLLSVRREENREDEDRDRVTDTSDSGSGDQASAGPEDQGGPVR